MMHTRSTLDFTQSNNNSCYMLYYYWLRLHRVLARSDFCFVKNWCIPLFWKPHWSDWSENPYCFV